MYTARIENKYGETLTLTGAEDRWQISDIDGLGPVQAGVIVTDLAGLDGARFNMSKLQTRNIVITLHLRGDVEANRLALYRFARTKELCTFYFTNGARNVYAQGYIETADVGLFERKEQMQISIICPDSYFRSVQETSAELTYYVNMFEFPFAIDYDDPVEFSEYIGFVGVPLVNNSETETGLVFKITCLQPISTFTITDTTTGEFMTVSHPFLEGDVITINTNMGQKSLRLLRGGVDSNIFYALDIASKFLQLAVGENLFSYSVDGGEGRGKVKIMMSFDEKYRGV